jgi:hypothetical protein
LEPDPRGKKLALSDLDLGPPKEGFDIFKKEDISSQLFDAHPAAV